MENIWITILGYVMTPIAAAVSWFVSKKKQDNDFLGELQSSIDVLTTENKKLYKELLDLRKELYERDKQIYELKKQLLR